MFINYIYCPSCGYEAFDLFVAFSSMKANGDFYICPHCGKETSQVEVDNI